MMGHRTKQCKLFAPTSLDALVPADNFYRRLEEKLDLSFARDLVRDIYEELGRRASSGATKGPPLPPFSVIASLHEPVAGTDNT